MISIETTFTNVRTLTRETQAAQAHSPLELWNELSRSLLRRAAYVRQGAPINLRCVITGWQDVPVVIEMHHDVADDAL